MPLSLALTGRGLRLTEVDWAQGIIVTPPPPPQGVLLVTQLGEALVSELSELILAEPLT